MAERLTEEELKALLAQEISSADHYDSEELSAKRVRALEYYQGIMADTPAAPNRSSVVSRDVADTIGWMLPGIIRVFTASDQMAEYEPVGKGDDEFAKMATDYCNYIFWKDNPGYRILWDATHDSLLQGNGIVKHWWDDSEDCSYSEHTGLTDQQVAMLLQDGGEVVAASEGEPQTVQVPGPDGQPVEQQIPTFDIKLKRVNRYGTVRVKCIKPEDFLLDADATCIEEARFCAHREEKTRSDLIEMGFSRDVVEQLPIYHRSGMQEESIARDRDETSIGFTGNDAMQPVELYECYIRADADGDGIAETIRAYYAGAGGAGELLDWEVWDDDVPFSDIPCEPVPHRWDARSVADETTDIQRVKTVLTRQLLDNLYWVNNPLTQGEEGAILNPEMMATPVFGGHIRLKKGAQPIVPLPVPFIGDKALMGLEHFDKVAEKRTGVSRSTMALDPEALTNQTATANQNQRDAAYSQIELIARNQAELGWRRVFKMILRLVVKHQDRPRIIRLRDEPVEMDPRFWNADMDCTINVGLGTGSRDRDMMMLNNIAMSQREMTVQMFQAGMKDKAVQMLPKVIKTLTKLAESSGIKNPDEYYIDITEEEAMQLGQAAMQPQPDPQVELEKAKLQMQMQLEQTKLQAKVQAEQMQMQREIEKERAQMQADLEVKMADMQAKMAAEQQKLDFEREKLAEEARQKELDRQQQWQLEMAKLNIQQQSQDKQLKHDEKARNGERRSKQNEALIASGKDPIPEGIEAEEVMRQMSELVASLSKAMTAPKRVVRDPETGKPVGVETVLN